MIRRDTPSPPSLCVSRHQPFQRGAPVELLALPLGGGLLLSRRRRSRSPSSPSSFSAYSVASIHDRLMFGLLLRVVMHSLSPAQRFLVLALPAILLALVLGLIALSTP